MIALIEKIDEKIVVRGEAFVTNRPLITIKGTRDGLTLYMDDNCSFDVLMEELEKILSREQTDEDDPLITVNIQLGYRLLHKENEDRLREIIRRKNKLVVHRIESEVIEKKEALKWKDESDIKCYTQIVRSGQVLNITGDLLLVGDVNPGGKVMATGNIFVLGSLRGIAHAGVNDNKKAVIAASYMEPSQLRIADLISRPPDQEADGVYMECGYVDAKRNTIIMDRLSILGKIRPDLNGLERRILNG